jgi:predicted transcriptional regulator
MPTTIRLEPELESRIDALAKRTGRTKANYLRQLIETGSMIWRIAIRPWRFPNGSIEARRVETLWQK